MDPVALPSGLVLRSATPEDAAQIPGFSADAHGENERHATAVLLRGMPQAEPGEVALTEGPGDWTVVAEGDRVVSTSALFRHQLRVGDQILPVGQIEYVATAPDQRRKGLVRRQFAELERRSAAHGDLLVLVSGIPHYYRRLGYGYALDWPERFSLPERITAPADIVVRPAQADDVGALAALRTEAQDHVGVALLRPRASWEVLVTEGPEWNDWVFVAEVHGEVVGSIRYLTWLEEPVGELMDGTARTMEVAAALLAAARAKAGIAPLCCFDSPGTPFSAALRAIGQPTGRWHPTYVRIHDVMAVLEALRPLLSRRLAASSWAAERGDMVLSWFEGAARISFADGAITGIEAAEPIEDPEDTDDTGIAPDSMPALLLGRFGAAGLERRTDDVLLGRYRDLMSILFPRLLNDHTFSI